MKKFIAFFIIISCSHLPASADHITGGEMSYTFIGLSGSTSNYRCTLKLYMRCNSNRLFNDPTIISVFRKSDNSRVFDVNVRLARTEIISLTDPDPCISNPPTVCYEVGYYEFSLALNSTAEGYIVAGQVNFRISGIANLSSGYSQIGATYTMEIPGTYYDPETVRNNSAQFTGSDLVIVCANNPFTYSFAADDKDKDELRYSFCDAYRSSSVATNIGNNATAPLSPPYQALPYGNNFSGYNPLGTRVSINPKTGLITGIAPGAGVYVITVCVEEIREGRVIATQRKDLQISITNCNLTAAVLEPEYQLCKDSKTLSISNLSLSSLINAYYWECRDQAGKLVFVTTNPTVQHTFADTGIYKIKLVINPGQRCTDSTTSIARVYPGFNSGFNFNGICFNKPSEFRDQTTTVYGNVNSWLWDFGDYGNEEDRSTQQNATYTYLSTGRANASLIVTNSKGCRDTVVKPVDIFSKPPILLAYRDTLICPPDQLELKAAGSGIFKWSSSATFVSVNGSSAVVAPLITTTYYVDLNLDDCLNRDSVRIRVTDKVELTAMDDTTICAGDNVQLRLKSNGLVYKWTPAAQLDSSNSFSPTATTVANTNYQVVASISNCQAKDDIQVTAVPYPLANAGNDTVVCFNSLVQLQGISDANRFRWSPSASLNNPGIVNPLASPASTTMYVLSVNDNKGCPKTVSDTVIVTVLPKIQPYAGSDTTLVPGQSIQLNATGGKTYLWHPATGLSANNTASPVLNFVTLTNEAIRYKLLVYNEAGCVDSAFMNIKIFSTKPTVFVPTGFTPNNDGKNDILRPIAVGMKQIKRFVIFNRYGQLVFSTTTSGIGWDGRINGQLQQTSSYVWMVEAVDYKDNNYLQKGTFTLLR